MSETWFRYSYCDQAFDSRLRIDLARPINVSVSSSVEMYLYTMRRAMDLVLDGMTLSMTLSSGGRRAFLPALHLYVCFK